jgi:hypothetical protein
MRTGRREGHRSLGPERDSLCALLRPKAKPGFSKTSSGAYAIISSRVGVKLPISGHRGRHIPRPILTDSPNFRSSFTGNRGNWPEFLIFSSSSAGDANWMADRRGMQIPVTVFFSRKEAHLFSFFVERDFSNCHQRFSGERARSSHIAFVSSPFRTQSIANMPGNCGFCCVFCLSPRY